MLDIEKSAVVLDSNELNYGHNVSLINNIISFEQPRPPEQIEFWIGIKPPVLSDHSPILSDV